MRKLEILCDMDSIIADLTKKWLEHYNRDFGDNLTHADITKWSMADNVKCTRQEIHNYLYKPEFFLDLEPLPGALEAVESLAKLGHDILIVSAPSWPGTSASDKISWAQKHMPFLNKRDISLMHQKHKLMGDVFIDDSPDNIKLYRQKWGKHKEWHQPKIMTIAYPYNESIKGLVDVYADGFQDTKKAWGTILQAIEELSR